LTPHNILSYHTSAPTRNISIMSSSNQDDSKNILEKTKEFMGEKMEQVKDAMPGSGQEAGAKVDQAAADAKEHADSLGNKVTSKVDEARQAVADATKPKDADEKK